MPSTYRFQDYEWAAQTDRLLARADELLTICTTPRVPTVSDIVGSVSTAFRSLAARVGVVAPPVAEAEGSSRIAAGPTTPHTDPSRLTLVLSWSTGISTRDRSDER